MPNLNLTDAQALACSPLPGHALLKVQAKAQEREPGSLVYKPESAAQGELERQAVREAVVVKVNREYFSNRLGMMRQFKDEDSRLVKRGATVYYLGHMDEMDNQYVVVRLGQIVAVKE
jgi:hypothetical protein